MTDFSRHEVTQINSLFLLFIIALPEVAGLKITMKNVLYYNHLGL
jgi:hypothetical protein